MHKDLKDSALYQSRFEVTSFLGSTLTIILAALCLVVLWASIFWRQNFSGVQVSGLSMYQTLDNRDWLLMKQVKNGEGLHYGDIIVVHVGEYPELIAYNEGKSEGAQVHYLIKRLIAMEGDTVKCENEKLYIRYAGTEEFVELPEEYAYYGNSMKLYDFGGHSYTVGKGEIFFLGDNRENSCDSRYKEFSGSHLDGRLYKATDVIGVVPQWAVEHKDTLEKIFFWKQLREAKL